MARRDGPPGRRLAGAAAVILSVAVAVAVGERTIRDTLEGRLVPVRVALPHAWPPSPAGLGLGVVARVYLDWQSAFFADMSRAPLARFAGDFDHLHHEPLEWWLETGPLGVAAWAWIGWAAWRGGRRRSAGDGAEALSVLAALCVLSLADFPLHRPADYLLTWFALGAACRSTATASRIR